MQRCPGLRPAGRQLRPGRLLPDALRAALLAASPGNYARLRPLDQIGLLADNWALGLAGYQSAAAGARPRPPPRRPNANARLLIRHGRRSSPRSTACMQAIPRIRRCSPASPRRSSARRMRRLGWTPRANEPANDAVLRDELIDTLGAIARSRGRRRGQSPLRRQRPVGRPPGPLRQTILGIVAYNADEATWERLRRMARDERNPLVRVQLYQLLGGVRDEALARRALDAGADRRAGRDQFEPDHLLGRRRPSRSRLRFRARAIGRGSRPWSTPRRARAISPQLGTGSADPAMIDKLDPLCRRST